MRILVTGGCGFIGSNLIRTLLAQTNHTVVNLDKLTYAANPASLADVVPSSRYELVRGDIAEASVAPAAIAHAMPDAVMHLAAESHVDRSIEGPGDFVQTNLVGTFRLLEACADYFGKLSGDARRNFRFLHVSTDEVYGSLGETGLFQETTPYAPHSPYAATKAGSDHLARAWYATYGLPVIVTNCSNNYGPYQFPEKLIPLMILKALQEQPLPVYGRGENVRDWLHVEDHVLGLLKVLDKGRVGETYNIGGNAQRRNVDIVRTICETLDDVHPRSSGGRYADLISFVVDRPGHDFRYAIDSTKMRAELGWQPRYELNQGLRQTIEWYLEHREWWQSILEGRYHLERLGAQRIGKTS